MSLISETFTPDRISARKQGFGFALPTNEDQPLIDKSGQVLRVEEREAAGGTSL
jgi:hypothetical protein